MLSLSVLAHVYPLLPSNLIEANLKCANNSIYYSEAFYLQEYWENKLFNYITIYRYLYTIYQFNGVLLSLKFTHAFIIGQ